MADVGDNDLAQIKKLISEVERSQNERSAEDFLALFRPDAVWVTAFGRRFSSKAEISDFTRKVLTPDLGDQYARYDVAHVTMLSPEVAAVNVRQRPIHKDGTPIEGEQEGSPLRAGQGERPLDGRRWPEHQGADRGDRQPARRNRRS